MDSQEKHEEFTKEIKYYLDAAIHYDVQMWIIPSISFGIIYFLFDTIIKLEKDGSLYSWSSFTVSLFGLWAIIILTIIFTKARSYQLGIKEKIIKLEQKYDDKEISLYNLYSGYKRCDYYDPFLIKLFRRNSATNWYLTFIGFIIVILLFWVYYLIINLL